MNTELEKLLMKESSFSSITQRLNNDLRKFSEGLNTNLEGQYICTETFFGIYNNLSYEQKQFLVQSYLNSSFSVLAKAINANMGATNESAANLFNFLLEEGFNFNKADLQYIKKNDNFAFKRYGSFGDIYEITWYYPLNKWANQVKNLAFKALKKNNSPIYLIEYPSGNIWLSLIKHYEKLPNAIQSLVLRDANEKDMKTILAKNNQGSAEDFNFFKKPII